MCLAVRCPLDSDSDGDAQSSFLVDVGFGGGGPPVPLPLAADHVTAAHDEAYKLTRGADGSAEDDWCLWALCSGEWRRLYTFDDAPRVRVADFAPACWYVCTLPGGLFTTTRFATRTSGAGRATMVHNELRLRERAEAEGATAALRVVQLDSPRAYAEALAQHLGVELSEDEAARVFAANAAAAAAQ
jgi:arylamine N-acetyltransferase